MIFPVLVGLQERDPTDRAAHAFFIDAQDAHTALGHDLRGKSVKSDTS